ncbi:MAG: discoidin domain-containing protein [Deltaproteobacteria bacterium]|nr:discoidin domain-containing protein [Deltaproteobacteria bacterium]
MVRGVWAAELGLGVPREGSKALVRTVGSKGRAKNCAQWVTSCRLSHSSDGIKWIFYQHDGSIVTFKGNVDANTEVRNDLPAPVTARYIRFNPVTWYGHITMRVEVFGIYKE